MCIRIEVYTGDTGWSCHRQTIIVAWCLGEIEQKANHGRRVLMIIRWTNYRLGKNKAYIII